MLPIVYAFVRSYAVYITLPIAVVVGFVGYKIENLVSDKYTPYQESIEQKRRDRQIEENSTRNATDIGTLRDHKFVPRTVFEKNVSPSLQ